MTGSNIISIDGRIVSTTTILIKAPLAISMHKELIISMLEKTPTPIVAAKKLKALTMIDCMEALWAMDTEAFLPLPRSHKYSVVHSCAKLDGSYNDRGYKRNNGSCVVRYTHIYKYGKLNN